MFPKHRAHRPFLKRLSQLWGRHSAVSLFSQIVSMGKWEQGDFCLSNLSEQDICLVFPYQLSQGDSWLMCFSGYSLPGPLAALLHAVWKGCGTAQLTSSPCGCPITSPAATSQIPSTPAGSQEGNRKTQSRDMIRNKASNTLSRMGYESRRQTVGCPNEQRVILIALSKSKERNKSHCQRHKTEITEPICYSARIAVE